MALKTAGAICVHLPWIGRGTRRQAPNGALVV